MKRVFFSLVITVCISLAGLGACSAEPPSGITMNDAVPVLASWAAGMLLFLGMLLLILETASSRSWGITGIAGILCVGSVVVSGAVTAAAGVYALILLLSGLGLLLVEAHLLRGYGLSALAGAACIFLGMFYALGGGAYGLAYALALSLMTSIMSLIAFLAYLPRNCAWEELARKAGSCSLQAHEAKGIRVKTSDIGHASVISVNEPDDKVREEREEYTARSRADLPVDGPRLLQIMEQRFERLKASAFPALTRRTALQRSLDVARVKLRRLDADSRRAVARGADDLALGLLIQMEECRIRVDQYTKKLESCRPDADAALMEIEDFRRSLQEAHNRIDGAHVRERLACILTLTRSLLIPDPMAAYREEPVCAACRTEKASDEITEQAQQALARLKTEMKQEQGGSRRQTIGGGQSDQ